MIKKPFTIFRKVCGLYFAFNVCGNCFSPAIQLQPVCKWGGKGAWLRLTLRFNHAETNVYWNGKARLWWNSEHLARKFGQPFEAPHGLCYRWGNHYDI